MSEAQRVKLDMHFKVEPVYERCKRPSEYTTPAEKANAESAKEYIYVSTERQETLYLIKGSRVLFESPANTGIRDAPTPYGRFTIYAKYKEGIMRGVDPRSGKRYRDFVHYIMYFNSGDAVHGFVRKDYGYPQSFGCVELPIKDAKTLFSMVADHTEVEIEHGRPEAITKGKRHTKEEVSRGVPYLTWMAFRR